MNSALANLSLLTLFSATNKPKNYVSDLKIPIPNTCDSISSFSSLSPPTLELQAQMLRKEIAQLIQIKNTLLEDISKACLLKTSEPISIIEKPQPIPSNETSSAGTTPKDNPAARVRKSLRSQIRDMVDYLLENIGKKKEAELEKEKENYADSPEICQVFDMLVVKYTSTHKTKEELVKFVLRKAFRAMKATYKKRMKMDKKSAYSTIANKYFQTSKEDIEDEGIEVDDDEEFLNVLMPFRKNSKNKTMNSAFLTEIFSSDDFCRDYIDYLPTLDNDLRQDNDKKRDKFILFVESCIKKNSLKEISSYKRIPWLNAWLDKTKEVAQELIYYAKNDDIRKKLCSEETKVEHNNSPSK